MPVCTRFGFATATEVLFGAGAWGEVAPRARILGTSALVVSDNDPGRAAPLQGILAAAI